MEVIMTISFLQELQSNRSLLEQAYEYKYENYCEQWIIILKKHRQSMGNHFLNFQKYVDYDDTWLGDYIFEVTGIEQRFDVCDTILVNTLKHAMANIEKMSHISISIRRKFQEIS